jgi:hypothetical protein
MSQKTTKITGYILTAILALLFGMSAFMKLTPNPAALEQAKEIGFNPHLFSNRNC